MELGVSHTERSPKKNYSYPVSSLDPKTSVKIITVVVPSGNRLIVPEEDELRHMVENFLDELRQ